MVCERKHTIICFLDFKPKSSECVLNASWLIWVWSGTISKYVPSKLITSPHQIETTYVKCWTQLEIISRVLGAYCNLQVMDLVHTWTHLPMDHTSTKLNPIKSFHYSYAIFQRKVQRYGYQKLPLDGAAHWNFSDTAGMDGTGLAISERTSSMLI